MTCHVAGNVIICGPTAPTVLRETSAGVKWCFVCRKRVEFTDTVWVDAVPSYYGPWSSRTCPRGHVDGDLFPGWYREGGDG